MNENDTIIQFDETDSEPINEASPEELSKIISYNVANSAEVLISKIDNDEVNLKPEFQRDFVWDINRSSLFIDSLLIGLPIPSIFLGKSKDDETYSVIDGQQRLKSVYFYVKGTFRASGKETIFSLRNLIDREWNGKTYAELEEKLKRRIRNAVLNTTVIEDIDSNPKLVHDIFQRLNTGGMTLTDQEIRNCVYSGPLNDQIIRLNANLDWRELLGKTNIDKRLNDVELILRFFALYNNRSKYQPSMREFLSTYQKSNKLKLENENLFAETAAYIKSNIGPDAFRVTRYINKSVCDAILVSIAQIIHDCKAITNASSIHKKLIKDTEFRKYTSSGTSSEASVKGRIDLARNYFLGLK